MRGQVIVLYACSHDVSLCNSAILTIFWINMILQARKSNKLTNNTIVHFSIEPEIFGVIGLSVSTFLGLEFALLCVVSNSQPPP
jgi:hypothetical protein